MIKVIKNLKIPMPIFLEDYIASFIELQDKTLRFTFGVGALANLTGYGINNAIAKSKASAILSGLVFKRKMRY